MDEKIKRIKNWINGIPDYPITLELNPTNRCNSKCLSCWLREFKVETNQELSKEKLLEIVKDAARLKVKEIRIPGSGEPLIKPGIMEVLKEIKKQDMKGLLITNGYLLDPTKIQELISICWDCITFSIDGPDAKTHDHLRGLKGSFKKIIANLELLKKIKIKEKKNKPLIRFNVVISKKNYNKIYEIFKVAEKYGCKDIQIQTLTVWGKEGEKIKLNNKEVKEFQLKIQKIKRFADKKGIFTNIETFKDIELIERTGEMDKVIQKSQKNDDKWLNLPCFEPWYNMIILPNGTIAPCSISGGKGGCTLKNKTLKEIWFGREFDLLRQNLLNNNLPEYCKTCCVAVHVENQRIKEELKKDLLKR